MEQENAKLHTVYSEKGIDFNIDLNKLSERNKEILFHEKLVFFDTETTGVDFTKDRIIDFSAWVFSKGKFVENVSFRINPEGKSVGDSFKVHKISDNELKKEKPFIEKYVDIVHVLEDALLVAHNFSFDETMLDKEFERANLAIKVKERISEELDTWDVIRAFYPNKAGKGKGSNGKATLDEFLVKAELNEEILKKRKEQHTADLDTKLLALSFFRFLEKHDMGKFRTVEQIAKESEVVLSATNKFQDFITQTNYVPVIASNYSQERKRDKKFEIEKEGLVSLTEMDYEQESEATVSVKSKTLKRSEDVTSYSPSR